MRKELDTDHISVQIKDCISCIDRVDLPDRSKHEHSKLQLVRKELEKAVSCLEKSRSIINEIGGR